jgi:hypothetical protein
MKVKGKCPRWRLRSGWEQVREDVAQREGRPWEEIEVEELWESKEMKRRGYQMAHLKWKCLEKKL